MGRCEGKVCFITGASQGIGRASAIRLAQEGAKVIVADINDVDGKRLVEQLNSQNHPALFVHVDVAEEAAVQAAVAAAVDKFGKVDVCVNNAGIVGPSNKPTHEISEEEWNRVMDVNAKGVFLVTKHVVPHMLKQGGGSIINVSAVAGIVGRWGIPLFCTSKGAVRLQTKADAIMYADKHIRVNSVHPGGIKTASVEALMKLPGWEDIESRHVLSRFGEPDDVAWAIVFLSADESKYVTGSEIVIDGGWTCH